MGVEARGGGDRGTPLSQSMAAEQLDTPVRRARPSRESSQHSMKLHHAFPLTIGHQYPTDLDSLGDTLSPADH